MNAASILVILIPAMQGACRAAGRSEANAETARERYLAKASRLKSRQLMASGGESRSRKAAAAGTRSLRAP